METRSSVSFYVIAWLLINVWESQCQDEVTLATIVSTTPQIPSTSSIVEGNEKEAIELLCKSAIHQIDDIAILRWYKLPNRNASLVEIDFSLSKVTNVNRDVYSLNNSTLSLTIKNVDTQYTGQYVCEASGKPKENTSEENVGIVLFKDFITLNVIGLPSTPPGRPEAFVRDARSLLVKWSPSNSATSSPILSYYIYSSSNYQNTTSISGGDATQDIVTLLIPFTVYKIRVRARNRAGFSGYSEWSFPVQTYSAAPDEMKGMPLITNREVYSSYIYLEYDPPQSQFINGKLLGYKIRYRKAARFNHVNGEKEKNGTFVAVTKEQYYNITGLEPYSHYEVNISVYNNVSEGPARKILNIVTKEDVPSQVQITNVGNQTSSSFEVRWKKPQKPNGEIVYYLMFVMLNGKDNPERTDRIDCYGPCANDYGTMIVKHQLRNLEADKSYDIQVCAATRVGCGPKSDKFSGLTDVEMPRTPSFVNVSSNTTTGLVVNWGYNMPSNSIHIKFYMIMNELLSYEGKPVCNSNKLLVPISKTRVHYSSYLEGLVANGVYRVSVAGGRQSQIFDKVLWGPYSAPMTIRLMSPPMPTMGPPSQKGMVVAVVCTVIAGLLLIAALLVAFFLRKKLIEKREYVEVIQDVDLVPIPSSYSETPPKRESLPVEEFESHVTKNHTDGDLGFSQEFDDLYQEAWKRAIRSSKDINQNTRTDLSSKHSLEQENKNKNRYINILAYDHSRVILKPMLTSSHSDYINGNYIEGYEVPRAYIATQGPLPNTFSDFWRMVWEQNSMVIIMITNLTEKGRRKCDQYWPHEGEHVYNNVLVKLEEESSTAHYILRRFKVKHFKERMTLKKKSNVEREILQFHFTEWPDHGVPNYCLPVLQFILKSVAAVPENSGPAVIHCSAGVGRTGTYIVIDTMMKQIMAKQTVNVFSYLSHIRNQRNYMVQTEDQYVFIHDVLVEYIQGGETEIKDFAITQYVKDLIKRKENDGSLLEKQFKLVTSFKPKDFHLTTSKMAINKEKIRSEHILPEELSRVRLPMKPGVQGSDYINASYFQGYNKTQEYIVTQHPLANTVEDFWRMCWDHNCMTVVVLSEVRLSDNEEGEDYIEFWPHKEEDIEYGNFQISFVGETQKENLVFRDFLLQSTQDDYECTTRLISTLDAWPGSCSPLHTAFELIDYVKQCHNQHEVEGPIVVVDRFGGKEAAIFCALSTLKDQLEHDHCIDVYMTAKLYHLKRPGVFISIDNRAECDGEQPMSCLDDYIFLYRCIESYYTALLAPNSDRDSGIGNGTHTVHPYHGSLTRESVIDTIPSARSPEKMPPPAVVRSMSRNSTLLRGSGGGATNGETTA